MLLNETEGFVDFELREAGTLGKFDRRLKPDLGLTALALNVNVHSPFFAGEQVEAEAGVPEDCGTHEQNDTRNGWLLKRSLGDL